VKRSGKEGIRRHTSAGIGLIHERHTFKNGSANAPQDANDACQPEPALSMSGA
jgi:hypothetical protein